MSYEYCIGVVGVEIYGEEDTFNFEGRKYKLLMDINVNKLKEDVRKNTHFCLKNKTNHTEAGVLYLCLFFIPWPFCQVKENIHSKLRIINIFFNTNEYKIHSTNMEQCEKTGASINPEDTDITTSKLYSMLREAHLSDTINKNIPNEIQIQTLKPQLRSYQNGAVRWMLNREIDSEYFPSEYIPIQCYNIPDIIFYYNPRTLEITDTWPGDIKLPTGGILADEMGLGKTVEMLALILCNKRSKRKYVEGSCVNNEVSTKPSKITLKCICKMKNKKNLLKCTKCSLFQHKKCVAKYSINIVDDEYICPNCWQYEPLVDVASTLIVSPPSIKMQWDSEVFKHINDPLFKVLIYNGIKQSGWISPMDISKYDIVLTDYNIMKSEIYFSSSYKREGNLRADPRYYNPISPLTMINWWRVCLDEAQMVETPANKCSQMVKSLPAVHRWAITGTPIEKTVDNLYGLIHFLDCQPYSDLPVWKEITLAFYNGDAIPLINVLKKVMWRTCKSIVFDQLNIPPQIEIVHNVTMSDLQALFYTAQHAKFALLFREKAIKLGESLAMFKMNAHTLKLIMEPLRKLRQDCSVPTIFYRTDQSVTKKVLNPDELFQHLVSNTEIDCKSELRSIASSLNGLAALHVIKDENDDAVKYYKNVLRWAKDYTGTISVDSLLQIHALHNLCEILELQGEIHEKDIENYQADFQQLEWKYIESCYLLIADAKEKQKLAEESTIKLKLKLNDKLEGWWRDVLFDLNDKTEYLLINKINADIRANYGGVAFDGLNSIREIGYIVLTWLDKIAKERKNFQNWFKKLEFFSENLKPKHQLGPDVIDSINNLIRTAFECHLNLDKTAEEKKKKQKTFCLLCQVKNSLNKYECELFDKVCLEDTYKNTTGTWNPTYQEMILKTIYSHMKKDIFEECIIQDGETHLALIEALKNEFKEYSKYWVEINYTVSAYDELNMCKSRLQAVDPEKIKKDENFKSKLYISIHEVDLNMQELTMQLKNAEKKFLQLQGKLRYLKYLEKNTEPDICPICKKVPENRYSVLECGHHLCIACLAQMNIMYKTYLDCCVCRHKQQFKNVYFVNCASTEAIDESSITFHGNYSRKIEEIVLTVLKLRNDDVNVKIIIFSHWDTVLTVISKALAENFVKFRKKSQKFFQSINEFKDEQGLITCLLLPLQYGSKGLNLIEATHVFLVEPILNPSEELQAIGRIHRIGQTRPTFVHRFIVLNTIEETIWKTISNDKTGKWKSKQVTVKHLEELFETKELQITNNLL